MKEFLCGLVAGFTSVTICHPLDVIRTRMNIMVLIFTFRAAILNIHKERTTPLLDQQSKRYGRKKALEVSIEVYWQRHRLFHYSHLDSLLQFHLLSYLSLCKEVCERRTETGQDFSSSAWCSCVWLRVKYTDESNMGM